MIAGSEVASRDPAVRTEGCQEELHCRLWLTASILGLGAQIGPLQGADGAHGVNHPCRSHCLARGSGDTSLLYHCLSYVCCHLSAEGTSWLRVQPGH